MPRYVAFLRGVSPLNAEMATLKRAFEAAGFSEVRTLLASGNVAFNARASSSDGHHDSNALYRREVFSALSEDAHGGVVEFRGLAAVEHRNTGIVTAFNETVGH